MPTVPSGCKCELSLQTGLLGLRWRTYCQLGWQQADKFCQPEALQNKFCAGAQPADVVQGVLAQGLGGVVLLDLLHDELGLGRLSVGNVDGVLLAGADVAQLVGQGDGREVQGALGQLLLAVAKGGFDDEHGHLELVNALPKGGVALGVAREHKAAVASADAKAHSGYGVHGAEHFDLFTGQLQHLAYGDFMKADEGRCWRGDAREVGPNDVVKNMRLKGRNGAG